MTNQIAMAAQSVVSYPPPSGNGPLTGGPQVGIVPKDADYVTWADSPGFAVEVKINGIDAREALLALDLLRKKDRAYEGLRISNAGSIILIQKLFRAEFDSEMPPVEMARQLGAKVGSHDAEAVISILRDCSGPF